MKKYYSCCRKTICQGCSYSFAQSGNYKCPFCNADCGKSEEERVEEMMKRMEANDAASMKMLAGSYYQGLNGIQQDRAKAIDLYAKAAELGNSEAHSHLGKIYHKGGNMKKAKFHFEAVAMAGDEGARYNLGIIEYNSGNIERAVKHRSMDNCTSAGDYGAIYELRIGFEKE
jgi:TPR repeat protein